LLVQSAFELQLLIAIMITIGS